MSIYFLYNESPEPCFRIKRYNLAIFLTPNVVEYTRLYIRRFAVNVALEHGPYAISIDFKSVFKNALEIIKCLWPIFAVPVSIVLLIAKAKKHAKR